MIQGDSKLRRRAGSRYFSYITLFIDLLGPYLSIIFKAGKSFLGDLNDQTAHLSSDKLNLIDFLPGGALCQSV